MSTPPTSSPSTQDIAPASAAEALVELRDVTFGYGDRPVLQNLSLRVPRGKVTALMGASGGGKTTVLRLIGGQHRAQQGCITSSSVGCDFTYSATFFAIVTP